MLALLRFSASSARPSRAALSWSECGGGLAAASPPSASRTLPTALRPLRFWLHLAKSKSIVSSCRSRHIERATSPVPSDCKLSPRDETSQPLGDAVASSEATGPILFSARTNTNTFVEVTGSTDIVCGPAGSTVDPKQHRLRERESALHKFLRHEGRRHSADQRYRQRHSDNRGTPQSIFLSNFHFYDLPSRFGLMNGHTSPRASIFLSCIGHFLRKK
jgi:hypothetical protein